MTKKDYTKNIMCHVSHCQQRWIWWSWPQQTLPCGRQLFFCRTQVVPADKGTQGQRDTEKKGKKGQRDKGTNDQRDKGTKGQRDKRTKGQRHKETKRKKDKGTKQQKENIILQQKFYNIFEVLCCILGTCTFLVVKKKTYKANLTAFFIFFLAVQSLVGD